MPKNFYSPWKLGDFFENSQFLKNPFRDIEQSLQGTFSKKLKKEKKSKYIEKKKKNRGSPKLLQRAKYCSQTPGDGQNRFSWCFYTSLGSKLKNEVLVIFFSIFGPPELKTIQDFEPNAKNRNLAKSRFHENQIFAKSF